MDTVNIRKLILSVWPAIALSVVMLVIVGLLGTDLFGGRALDQIITQSLIILIVVIALYLFIGISGVWSFGHIAFMAIGAYVTALLSISPTIKHTFVSDLPEWIIASQIDPMVATAIGALCATIVGAILAVPLMRLNGLAAGVATLALLLMTYEFIVNASGLTGGQQTLLGIPNRTTTVGLVVVVICTIFFAYWFQQSRYGLMLAASRDDREAAVASGVNIHKLRCIAFSVSAGLAGLAGGLYAQVLRTVSVDSFHIDMTFMTIMMLVVGGVRSLSGAVVGVLTITMIREIVRRMEAGTLLPFIDVRLPTGTVEVVLGFLMLLILILRPSGVMGNRELVWPFRNCLEYRKDGWSVARDYDANARAGEGDQAEMVGQIGPHKE